jgi:IS1 family transposase
MATKSAAVRLTEAEDALHELLRGSQVVELSYDGRTVKYTKAEIGELRGYIADLRRQTGAITRSRKSIGLRF